MEAAHDRTDSRYETRDARIWGQASPPRDAALGGHYSHFIFWSRSACGRHSRGVDLETRPRVRRPAHVTRPVNAKTRQTTASRGLNLLTEGNRPKVGANVSRENAASRWRGFVHGTCHANRATQCASFCARSLTAGGNHRIELRVRRWPTENRPHLPERMGQIASN